MPGEQQIDGGVRADGQAANGDFVQYFRQAGVRYADAPVDGVDREPEAGLHDQKDCTGRPGLRGASDGVERRRLAGPAAEAAEELRHPLEIDVEACLEQ